MVRTQEKSTDPDTAGGTELGTFEEALAATERMVDDALKSAGSVTRELKKALAGARTGQVREVRRALAAAQTAADALADEAQALQEGLDLDEQAYLTSGAYTKELIAAAQARGVTMLEEDDQLLCYPSLLRVRPADAAVEIDKVRERRLRPSVLVELLAKTQQRAPRFKPEPFVDSLRSAYELIVASENMKPDAVVRLDAIWAALTMLPGQRGLYSKQEFARDLYLLDQSGVTSTGRSTRRLRWSASTGTKGTGVLVTVGRTGQQQRYWGVSFSTEESAKGQA